MVHGAPHAPLAGYAPLAGCEHEAIPPFTARLLNVWANSHRELGDTAASGQFNAEALELALRVGFPPPDIQARIDLLFCDLADGDFGRASTARPALQGQATAACLAQLAHPGATRHSQRRKRPETGGSCRCR